MTATGEAELKNAMVEEEVRMDGKVINVGDESRISEAVSV